MNSSPHPSLENKTSGGIKEGKKIMGRLPSLPRPDSKKGQEEGMAWP